MERLGDNSALDKLAQQIEVMQATMVTGFANLAATAEKTLQGLAARQVKAIEEGSTEVTAALDAAGMKAQMARERQMDRQLSTDSAFNQARQGMLEGARDREIALESLFDRAREEIAQKGLAARILDYDREEQIAVQWAAALEKSRERVLAGEALFERVREETAQRGLAARILDYDREEQIAAQWVASLEKTRERELAGEAAFNRAQAEMLAKREAEAAAAAERNRALNTGFLTASPASQVRTASQAQIYSQLGGDASARYGSEASAAGALAAAQARLATTSREAGAAQLELDGALRQVEGAFRGAAHQAGIYGFHHGQLIALLAGGAVAAGLHHIAETGAEVEFQLASLNALSGEGTPVDMNKFIGITAGSMTSLKDAAEGVHALAQAGQDQGAAFAALPDVMRLASLGEMSVAQASEMAVESMHAFGKEITDLGNIGDILVAVGAKSNLSVHKLAEDMKSAAVTGALFNLNMEEITATVGALAERGLTIQPLSSALNKLYEPSAKTAKVMKDWHLEVKDGEGNLKSYTKFMGELAAKVGEFRVPADALKQLGMSPQSIKAMEVMTQHLGDYKHLLEEAENAHGKMFDAMLVKEDTVEGAWKRLGSTVEGSLVKAFESASPAIREVEASLMHMAGSESFQNALANIAGGVARLTQTLVEGVGPLTSMLVVYAGLRILATATTWINEFVIAQRAQAIATATTTTALRAETVQLELFATAENTAATGATRFATSLDILTMSAAGISRAFGWISLVVIGATVAIDLLGGRMDKFDQEQLAQQNSFNNTVDAVQREIDRLKGLEDQLRKTGETGTSAAAQVAIGFAQMQEASAEADLAAAKKARPQITATSGMMVVGGLAPVVDQPTAAQQAAVDAAQIAYDKAHAQTVKALNLFAELDSREEDVKTLMNVSSLKKKVHELPENVTPVLQTPAAKAAAEAANAGLHALHEQEITEGNVVELTKTYDQVQKNIAATKREITAINGGDKDTAHVRIEQLQEELRLAQMLSKSRVDDLKSENKRGELGDLQLINKELAEKLSLDQKALDLARAELASAGPLKPGQQEKFNSRIKSAKLQVEIDQDAAERQKLDLFDKMNTAELQARAQALQSRGQLEDAFLMTWEAKNAATLANLRRDMADSDNQEYVDRLQRYEQFLLQQKALGQNDARFKEGKEAFGAANATLRERLSDAALQNGPGSGLYSSLNSGVLAQQAYGDMIPQLQAAQARVAPTSSIMRGGDASKIKEAQNELRQIQEQMAAMRNTTVSMAQEIGKALTEAFGKGGTALGSMLTATAAYGAKVQEIQATLKDSGGGEEAKAQAANATASAQLKAYGDMSSAAKGFFDVNSNGYKILHATEQTFRAFELAQALTTTAKKIFFKETEVATSTALNGTKVAGEAATTAASTTLAGVEASAWGVTAVAKAIASLPFPFNLAAGAATMAALLAVGVKLTGGFGGGSNAADRQAENGTGTIAGDPKAKSESLAKSMALVEKNTYNGLTVSVSMLTTLQSIDSTMANFAGLVLQNSNIANPEVHLNTNNGLATTAAKAGVVAAATVLLGPIGGVVTALAMQIPVIGNVLGKIGTAIFGGKQTLDDSGFMMGPTTLGAVAAAGVSAKTYADVTTSGGWFSSDKHNTQSTTLDAEANRAIAQVITGIGDSIKTASAILGLSGSEFDAKLNGFVIDIGKISLKGLSSADQQAAIQSAFSKLSDQMTTAAVANITQFSKAGEGALETLTRVATDYQTVDAVFQSFGIAFAEVGVSSIGAREKLIELSGGLSKFTSQAEFFFKNFLTEGQQTAATRNAIDPTLGKYGLSTVGPDAVQKFAQVTLAFGAMGEAGAAAYAELMNIAPAFKTVTDVAKDLQDQIDSLLMTQAQKDAAARAALDPANQALFDQLQQAKAVSQARSSIANAYQSEASTLQSAIDKLKSFSASLHSFVNSLQLGGMSTLNPADKYGAALSQFNTTLAKAQAGDSTAQGNLQSAAQAFLQASRDANASNSTYQSDYDRVTAAVNAMADMADGQVSEGQQNLAALYQQISQLTTLNESALSIVEAVNNLAIVNSGGKDSAVNTSSLMSLYQELLGRAPDAEGFDFWSKALQNGTSFSSIVTDFKNSPEYLARMGAQQPVTSVSPSTQYGVVAAGANPTSQLTGLYQQLLGRAPDAEGFDFWSKAMQNGVSLSSIATDFMKSPEYLNLHSVPTTSVTTDPYSGITAQNAQMIAQLTVLNGQMSGLRAEQQTQADQQVYATMSAGATTGDDVAEAITSATMSARWDNSNQVTIR